jgi:NADPH2:quinone reductase
VGKDTLLPSLDCLAPFGKLVNYGNASGPAPAVDPMLLSAKGSLSLARLAVGDHVRAPADYLGYSAEVLDLCGRGVLRPHLGAVLPLAEAAEAHRMIEAGLGPGAIVLVP